MKPVVPVHVFTGPVFSYNKTNVICHIHYFNPRNKVYIKNIYISKLRREVCSFYLANFPWLSKELLPVNGLSCLCKEKCHSIHMFHYVWSRWLHSFHKGLFFFGGGGSRCIAISAFYTILRWCHLSDFVLAVNKMGLTFTFHSCLICGVIHQGLV